MKKTKPEQTTQKNPPYAFGGGILKLLREDAELTLEQLSLHLGRNRQSIAKWEKGTRTPDLKTIIVIAQFFKMKPSDFIVQA